MCKWEKKLVKNARMHRHNEKLNRVNDQDKLLTQLNLRVEATNKYTGYKNTVSSMINLDSKKCKKNILELFIRT